MRDKIEAILRRVMEIENQEMDGDADLSELGLTSLSLIEVIVVIEEELGIEMDDEDLLLDRLNTLNKVEACVRKACENNN